jgi:hypothetical protein
MAHNHSLVGLVCGEEEGGLVSMRLIDTTDPSLDICLDEALVSMGVAENEYFVRALQ